MDATPAQLGEATLAVLGRVIEGGQLVVWQRRGEAFFPLAVRGEVPPTTAENRRGLPLSCLEPYGVLSGRRIFLTAGDLLEDARWAGLRGVALLPVLPEGPGREVMLAAYRVAPFERWSPFEQDLLTAAARTLNAGLVRQRHRQALEATRTNTLTGLGNRRALELDLEEELGRARRQGTEFGLLSVELDGVGQVNDLQGQAHGDALRRVFARALRQCLRQEDRVHRLGGDQYVLVLPGVSPTDAPAILERVGAAVDATRAAGFAGVEASAGMACFPADGPDAAALVRLMDARAQIVPVQESVTRGRTRSG